MSKFLHTTTHVHSQMIYCFGGMRERELDDEDEEAKMKLLLKISHLNRLHCQLSQ